jgi:hypothetical protein
MVIYSKNSIFKEAQLILYLQLITVDCRLSQQYICNFIASGCSTTNKIKKKQQSLNSFVQKADFLSFLIFYHCDLNNFGYHKNLIQ